MIEFSPDGELMNRLFRTPAFTLALVTLTLFTDMAVYDLVIPFLPQYAGPWLSGESELGLLFGTYALALLASLPFTGRITDRYTPRRALLLGCAGLLATLLLYSLANGRILLFAARMIQGVSGGITWTAGLAQLASIFPVDQRGKSLGVAMTGMSLGTLVGPPLGGILFDSLGGRWPFILVAIWVSLLLIGLMVLLPRKRVPHASETVIPRRERWKPYFGTAIFVVLGATFLSCLEPTLPLNLQQRLGSSPSTVGLLFGLAALVYGIISPVAGFLADRVGNRRTMLFGLFSCAVTLPLVAIPTSVVGESFTLIAFGASCSLLLTPTLPEFAVISERHGKGTLGSAYSLFNFVYAFGMAIGPILAGLLEPLFGLPSTLGIIGIASLGVLVLFRQRISTPDTRTPPVWSKNTAER